MDSITGVMNINKVDYLFHHYFFPENAFGGETNSIQTKHSLSNQNTNHLKGMKHGHIVLYLGPPECNPLLS